MAVEGTIRYLMSASEIYDQIEFKTGALFNEPAPDPWVAFLIGGLFSACSVVMWSIRVWNLKIEMEEAQIPFVGSSMVRALLSATIDSSSSPYVIVSYSAASFLLLGGFQLDYEKTMIVMMILYFITSSAEILRIILSFRSTDSLENLRLSCDILRAQFREMNHKELRPSNLYEDLGRGMSTVVMTFLTQCLLISFVFVDTYENSTTSCRDSTPGCPIVGTFGSWGFYVIGIYMACVFLLGPKTNYGSSEQNPAYWIQLLILARCRPKITWYDPIKHRHHERQLSLADKQIWFRFFMTFLINGVGFHILVHALPIQVAKQSSFTGVVFRAVGMMYLVDLDDTTGYTLTVVEDSSKREKVFAIRDAPQSTLEAAAKDSSTGDFQADLSELSSEAQRIIDEARAKLELLARTKGVGKSTHAVKRMESAGNVVEGQPVINTDSESDEEVSKTKRILDIGVNVESASNDGISRNKSAKGSQRPVYDAYEERSIEVSGDISLAEF